MSAQIVTFYSYTDDVDRSARLINTAWALASCGKRVLLIDANFRAPSLHRFLRPFLTDANLTATEGLLDLLTAYMVECLTPRNEAAVPGWHKKYADLAPYTVGLDWSFPGEGVLDLVPAGRQDDQYAFEVAAFNWKRFYAAFGGGAFLESLKEQVRDEYDYILVDSPAGTIDPASTFTVQIPDRLVVCIADGNVQGSAAVMHSVREQWERPDGVARSILPLYVTSVRSPAFPDEVRVLISTLTGGALEPTLSIVLTAS